MITNLVVGLSRTGAGDAVMWFMVALSVISIGLIIERLIFFTMKSDNVRPLAAQLNTHFQKKDFKAARELLSEAKGFGSRVLLGALDGAHLGRHAVEELAASSSKVLKLEYERFLSFLGTVGNNAPFIGLFGTVLEIIAALYELGSQSGGNVGAGAVMAKLSAALAATAVGLLVALPAVAMYNFFTRRIKTMQAEADALVHVLLAHIDGDGGEAEKEG
jgi:biopolymer transport protein ExbB